MMNREAYRAAKEVSSHFWAWVFGLGGTVLAVMAGLYFFGVIGSVASAPGRVINRTMETGNIIHNYEWFHDVNAAFKSRVAQITAKKKSLSTETDKPEVIKLRIDLEAMQQSCRDLANKYNANSIKTNVSIFKGQEAPETLNASLCE